MEITASMREYQIPFTKSLLNGLQNFSANVINNPQLFECHNLMPIETGLVGHETIYSVGLTKAYFNYLEIRQQSGKSWYWYPVFDGHILVSDSIPNEPSTGADAVALINAPIPYWVEILDENLATWYLYPNDIDGFTRATDTKPAVGTGVQDMVWRGTTSEFWKIGFDNASKTRYAVKV